VENVDTIINTPPGCDVLVIGAGAAGLICAGKSAARGRRTTVLERTARPARKLGITGKGRCNLTNNCDIDAFMGAVRTNRKFLYSAYNALPPQSLMALIEGLGVPLKTERGQRVFPVSDKASDIVNALVSYAKNSGAQIRRERAAELIIKDNYIQGVKCESGQIYPSPNVVIATGGLSYPATGSTGDGYLLARQAGHSITPARASLVPIVTYDSWCRDVMGLSLKNVKLSLTHTGNKKPLFKEQGEMLFTHFGISGPLVLSVSVHMSGCVENYRLGIDLKPALAPEQLDMRILRDFSENQNRDFVNSLGALLPRGLIWPVVKLSGIPPERKVHQITKEERQRFAGLLKDLPLHPKALRPVEEAVVTAGGVDVSEINPKTMQSKLVNGLYFAGEVLDADAYTGGFNLQIAFSTGYLAGENV
jgi:predicted Rossmann fold flavoprotein